MVRHAVMTANHTKLSEWLRTGALLGRLGGPYSLAFGPFVKTSRPHPTQRSWYLPDFFSTEAADWWIPSQEFDIPDLANFLGSHEAHRPQWKWQPPNFDSFADYFHQVQNAIAGGMVQKVVPVVFEQGDGVMQPETLLYMLKNLLNFEGDGYVYGAWDEGEGILGLTPELLAHVDGKVAVSMALAGTAQFADHDLLSDEKEMSEHRFVLDEITENLRSFGKIEVGITETYQPSALTHLRTDISLLSLKPLDIDSLVRRLHPTPALGGKPATLAKELIKKIEGESFRGSFGAPFGYRNPSGEGLAVVGIRNIQWRKESVRLGSGCGIVEQSQLNSEWDELARKRGSVKRMMGI